KINFAQGTLRYIGRVVVAARFDCAISDPMFSAGDDAIRRAVVRALKAAHARARHDRTEIRVFARTFDDASPTRVARTVEHRPERPMDAGRTRFVGRNTRRAFDLRRVPTA